MNIDGSPGVMRRLIAFGLKKLRQDAGLSQAQVAKHMRRAQGSIANWEKDTVPRLEVVEKLLTYYGAEDQIPKYTAMLELAEQKSWWEGLSETREPAGFDVFLGLEEGASKIESFDPLIVPGLLQTESYARAVTLGGQRTDTDLDRKVALRMKRQEALTRPKPLHLWAVIDETALDRPIGDAETRRGQLDHLVRMSERANVQLQVIPREVGAYPGLTGAFEILHFPLEQDPGVVYVETRVRAVWFEQQAEIDQHTQVMNHLRALALAPEQSSALIAAKQKEV
jgi:transcriptional regulator with XRE-family HTH domain